MSEWWSANSFSYQINIWNETLVRNWLKHLTSNREQLNICHEKKEAVFFTRQYSVSIISMLSIWHWQTFPWWEFHCVWSKTLEPVLYTGQDRRRSVGCRYYGRENSRHFSHQVHINIQLPCRIKALIYLHKDQPVISCGSKANLLNSATIEFYNLYTYI